MSDRDINSLKGQLMPGDFSHSDSDAGTNASASASANASAYVHRLRDVLLAREHDLGPASLRSDSDEISASRAMCEAARAADEHAASQWDASSVCRLWS